MTDAQFEILIQTNKGKAFASFQNVEEMTAFISREDIIGVEIINLSVSSLDLSNTGICFLSIADCPYLKELQYGDDVTELELLGCTSLQIRLSESLDRLIIRANKQAVLPQPQMLPSKLEILELAFLPWSKPIVLPKKLKEFHLEEMSAKIVNLPPTLQSLNLWDWHGTSLPDFPSCICNLGLWDCSELELTTRQLEQIQHIPGIGCL